MNWLAYLTLLFSVLFLFLRSPWSLRFGIAAAVCGLASAMVRHRELLKKGYDSFLSKVAIAAVAAAALLLSPWIANSVLSEITLLRPSALPAAYSAFQYIAVALLWALPICCALVVAVLFDVKQIVTPDKFVKAELLGSLGRLSGLLVLLFYLTPMFLHAANFDSGVVLSRIVLMTSFVRNEGQYVFYSSSHPQLPSACTKLAREKNLDLTKPYSCSARTIRCSNLEPTAQIAFLDDKGTVVLAKELETGNILHELVPVRFDIAECKSDNRYVVEVTQNQ